MRVRKPFEMLALTSAGVLLLGGGAIALAGHGSGGSSGDLGDQIILLRDASGVPIPSSAKDVTDPETGLTVPGGRCWQPIAFPSETCAMDCSGQQPCLVPVDQYSCAVEAEFAGCTREVDFGRINEARSPDDVFLAALEEVVVNLATADCVTLDPAGRLVAGTVADDGTVSSHTVDSPLQNLAIYRQLMMTGELGVPLPPDADIFDTAARALGAAADKSGGVNVDLVAYLNQIMGLSDPGKPSVLGKICETYREEVQGEMQEVQKCFLNYGPDLPDSPGAGADYAYSRVDNFGRLPAPAYIPADDPETVENESREGWFEYLLQIDDVPTFTIMQGPVLDAVFCVDIEGVAVPPDPLTGYCSSPGAIAAGFSAGNIGGFAQAADDARAVIAFMHTYPVLEEFATPIVCSASGGIAYDVSISSVSGLQVPRIVVDGSEGREFSVTVSNAGPDSASGIVTVTARVADGSEIDGSPWSFPFSDLTAGMSRSFTEYFSVNVGGATTIAWTATAEAQDDVNLQNNTVTALSTVKTATGGRRR